MKIALSAEQMSALTAFLKSYPDSEALSEKEYVLDLYDLEPPLSLDLVLSKNAVFVDGAAELLFDEEMDGWYIGKRVEDPDMLLRALTEAGALGR